METGKLIKTLRLKKGMTQEELAEKTELSTRTIQRIENGEVDPRSYTLQMIAKALDVEYDLFAANNIDGESRTKQVNDDYWLGLLHFSGIIPLIFPSLLIWKQKKDKIKGMAVHIRFVSTFQLMVLGVILACVWVYWKTGILTPLIGVLLVNGLISLVNTIKVINGAPFINLPFFNTKDRN